MLRQVLLTCSGGYAAAGGGGLWAGGSFGASRLFLLDGSIYLQVNVERRVKLKGEKIEQNPDK
jgi:hypothetical protein